ncbi:hypothetical protein [Streptomyces sp. P17]|nr:hypothetical protein [Streptomyces sp. P17]
MVKRLDLAVRRVIVDAHEADAAGSSSTVRSKYFTSGEAACA